MANVKVIETRNMAPKRYISKNFNRHAYIFLIPFTLSFVAFGLFPILYSLVISFTDWDGINSMKFIGFKNYIEIFTKSPYFLMSIKNTLIFMVFYIPIVLIIGLLLAVGINSKLLKFNGVFRVINFLPYITTPVAVGILFSMIFDWKTGLLNNVLINLGVLKEGINWLGAPNSSRMVVIIMLIWKLVGYHMVIYSSALVSISHELYEAASLDGASAFQQFTRISIPLLKPVTLFLVITDIIAGFQLIEEPMLLFTGWASGQTLIGGPERAALTAVWNMYDTAFLSYMRYGLAAAISYGLFMFIIVFSFIGFKFVYRKGKTTV